MDRESAAFADSQGGERSTTGRGVKRPQTANKTTGLQQVVKQLIGSPSVTNSNRKLT